VRAPEELRRRLLALNHAEVPFTLAAGGGGKEGDVVAEWKIVDATWYEIFAKAGLKESHKIYLCFDLGPGAVRVRDESWSVEWRAGVPVLSMSAEAFRGRTISSKRFGRAYAFKGVSPLDYGEVYDYRFDVAEMKDPIAEVITGAGCTFRPATSKRKLAG
jgi:hypothetical protein